MYITQYDAMQKQTENPEDLLLKVFETCLCKYRRVRHVLPNPKLGWKICTALHCYPKFNIILTDDYCTAFMKFHINNTNTNINITNGTLQEAAFGHELHNNTKSIL